MSERPAAIYSSGRHHRGRTWARRALVVLGLGLASLGFTMLVVALLSLA